MRPPIVIRTPFAGAERAAEILGVSPARTRRLIALAKESMREEDGIQVEPKQQPRAQAKTRKRKQKKSRRK